MGTITRAYLCPHPFLLIHTFQVKDPHTHPPITQLFPFKFAKEDLTLKPSAKAPSSWLPSAPTHEFSLLSPISRPLHVLKNPQPPQPSSIDTALNSCLTPWGYSSSRREPSHNPNEVPPEPKIPRCSMSAMPRPLKAPPSRHSQLPAHCRK